MLFTAVVIALAGCSESREPGQRAGLGEPGGPPSFQGQRTRGDLRREPISAVVLAAGRAPDGARYELVLERFAELEECLHLEWPDARFGQVGPGLGCRSAFPRARPSEPALKVGGPYLSPHSTRDIQLAGLARPDVSRVRVTYKADQGTPREAPVHFVRAGLAEAVGIYLAFLPPSIRYRPQTQSCPERGTFDRESIELTAYDHQGEEIAREKVWNIFSTDSPSCL